MLLDFQQGGIQRGGLCGNFGEVRNMGGAAVRGQGAEYRVRETQNQNDADDANDAESGIWYRDIPKTASLASSASLSSRKNSAGVWGTPQKCVCGYPNAMLAKHVYPQNDDKQTRYPHKFVYALKSESLLIHPKILTRKSESVLIHFPKRVTQTP